MTPQKSPWKHYREIGFSLFPTKRDKRPVVDTWKPYQTRFPTNEEIASWGKAKYNIAIVTGKLSNLLVIDTDTAEATAEFEELVGDLFESPIVETPRGGRHYYFRLDSRFPRNQTFLGISKKIDIRSEGGYVLAPPSETEDGQYKWIKNCDLKTPIPELVPDLAAHRLLNTLMAQVKTITPGPKLVEGRRDNDLFLSACKLKDQGLNQATVETMVKAEAKMCIPPFSEAEAVKKVRSAFSRPPIPMSFKMSDIEEEEIIWLWPNYVPSEALTLINGDPNAGKSWFALDMACRVSRGLAWPDLTSNGPAANVYYMTYEDSLSKVLKKRIRTLGGDHERIIAYNSRHPIYLYLSTEEGMKRLEAELIRIGNIRLLVIDPILDFISASNPNAVEVVRALLTPIISMCERLHIALIMIGHLNKDQMKAAIYRAGGSTGGWMGKARAAFLVARDPEDKMRRYLMPVKCNYAFPEPVQMEFEIIGSRLEYKACDINIEEILNPAVKGRPPTASLNVKEVLADMFRNEFEIPSAEVEKRLENMGVSESTWKRVKKKEGYFSECKKGENKEDSDYWIWKKPLFKK